MEAKNIQVLAMVEALLGVTSEYKGCCADGDQLPSLTITAEKMGHTLQVESGTNLIHKLVEFLQDEVQEYNPNLPQDGSGILPSDRERLITIKSLVDEMLS